MNEELVESPGLEVPGGLHPAGDDNPGKDEGESIFDYGSKIGLLLDSEGTGSMTELPRHGLEIVVPRKEFYHPSEGLERSVTPGPMLANLGDLRKTIASSGKVLKDNWREAGM